MRVAGIIKHLFRFIIITWLPVLLTMVNERRKKMKNKLRFMTFLVLALMLGFSGFSSAAEYPTKPIECLLPFGPGSVIAVSVKVVTDAASKLLGQPILMVSAGGAGGTIAGVRCASSKPDGYTLLATNSATNGTALYTRKEIRYKNSDFEFLALYARQELGLIVKADAPFKSLEEFIAYGKANNIKFAYQGVGTGQHICMELLKLRAGGLKIDYVPVISAFDLRTSVIGGHTHASIIMGGGGGLGDEFRQAIEGGARILAVASRERLKPYPDVPTYVEKGLDVVYRSWVGIAGPKGMPKEVSEKLKSVLYEVLKDPQVIQGIERLGYKFEFRKSDEFTKYVQEFEDLIKKVVEEAKISPI